MTRKLVLLASACLVSLAVIASQMPAQAAKGDVKTVKLKNGRELTGEVTSTESGYQIKIVKGDSSQTVSVLKEQVDQIVDVVDPLKEYKDRLAKIDPKKADARYELAKWAFDKKLYDQALENAEAAIAIDKGHIEAPILIRQIKALAPTTATTKPDGPTATKPDADADKAMLGDDDINRIRLAELRDGERGIQIEFAKGLIDRYVEAKRGSENFETVAQVNAFRNKAKLEQALAIRKDHGDEADWMDGITVKSDPKFMVDFRNKVYPVVSNFCASPECHGGAKAHGALKLFNPSVKNEKVLYTNFVLLDGYRSEAGRLINRDSIEESLLLKFGLPAASSQVQHPKKIKQAFESRDDQKYKDVYSWIRALQPPPHPDYRLKYQPPAGMKLDFGVFKFDNPTTTPGTGPK